MHTDFDRKYKRNRLETTEKNEFISVWISLSLNTSIVSIGDLDAINGKSLFSDVFSIYDRHDFVS